MPKTRRTADLDADIEAGEGRRRGSGARFAYEILRDEILALALAPGSLIDEARLAERLRMSRTPVREALVRLAGEGLVFTLPNRGAVVAPIDFLQLPPYFDALSLMHRATARLAARHHRPGDIEAIRQHQTRFAAAVRAQDALAMIATNAAFHLAIAEAGRNPHFTALFGRLLDEGRRLLRLYYQSHDDRLPQRFVDEHEAMIAAIEQRDVAQADALARAHARQIVEQMRRLIAAEDGDGPDLSADEA